MASNKQNSLGSRNQVFRGFEIGDRAIGTRTSYAVVNYFHYKKQNFVTPSNMADFKPSFDVETGIIDSDIAEVTVSKSIQQASATFSISLFPSKNWKQVLSAGDWVIIYFKNKYDPSQPDLTDTRDAVLIGSIDRISRSLARNEDEDKTQLRYNVSGRNFGKVFEEQDIWFDPYSTSTAGGLDSELNVFLKQAGLEITGGPKKMIESLVGIFLGNGGDTAQGKKSGISAWGMPIPLVSKFVSSTSAHPKFFDILATDIPTLPGYKARDMITVESNGSLWDMVERNSNKLVNECFLEEVRQTDGTITPTLIVKPRPLQTPFFLDLAKAGGVDLGELKGAYQTLQDLAKTNFIELSQSEIKYEDLGKDDHSRMNFFWLRTPQASEHGFRYNANLNEKEKISNPVYSRESIQRHGLKRLDQQLDFCFAEKGNAVGVQKKIWQAFVCQMYDMHFANHLYDAGTIECTGVLEAELGKALIVLNAQPEEKKKVYFIEGYEHRWSLQDGWTTTFTLTHGQWLTDGKNIFIDATDDDFGQLDEALKNTYVAQTESER